MSRYSSARFILVLAALLCSYVSWHNATCQEAATRTDQQWITVFVHGIMSVKYHLTWQNVKLFWADRVHNTPYQRAVELIRNDPYFRQAGATQERGLKKIDIEAIQPGASVSCFAKLWDKIARFDQQESEQHVYYTFGWSGLMSPRSRLLEARDLCQALQHECESYRERGITPKVRLVGYSHGGNLCLELANVQTHSFAIDELILVGVPLNREEEYLAGRGPFKKIFSFYSHGDRVQKLDCFSRRRLFSQRTFHKNHQHITQIQIQIKRLVSESYARSFKDENGNALRYPKRDMRPADPGHTEWWSFGWDACGFSQRYPLAPLPAGLFVPFVLNNIQKDSRFEGNISADIWTHAGTITLKNKKHKYCITKPFVPRSVIQEYISYARQFEPKNYSKQEYLRRINEKIRCANDAFAWDQKMFKSNKKKHTVSV